MTSDISQIQRLPERGTTDRQMINEILDEGLVCHVAYVVDDRPVVIPTLYVRDEDRLLLHGSHASGIARAVKRGSNLSAAVTHIDGLVVARTGFHSSANYRSVVAHGKGRLLEGTEHAAATDVIVDGLIPGRAADVRPATTQELRSTAVIELTLDEVSAKVRTGPPVDEPEDLNTGVWAGVVPISVEFKEPTPAADLEPGIAPPEYLTEYRR
ncbi:MAG: pyridoxamine 5'-phosphate oxidase family protein [Acidimicrobiia bacterium]